MNWQQAIPRGYTQMGAAEAVERIAARKAQLGDKVVILGHHYQQDDVVRFADVLGDSFQLSREAAKLTKAQYVVFCGVHFMAESADILTGDHQQVILPDLGAGCSMADMAALEDVEDAWQAITEACKGEGGFQAGADHVHEFERGDQVVCGGTRGGGVHVEQLREDFAVGARREGTKAQRHKGTK